MAESPSQSAAQLVAHQSLGHEAESDLSSLVFGLFFSLLLLVVFTLSSDLGISASSYMFSFVDEPCSDGLLIRCKFAEMSQQVQLGMENMLKLVNEIDGNSVGIKEEIERSKEFAMEKKRALEEEKEQFQKAAYTILDMLSNRV
ncbi:hypothetical protein Bca101_063757 [Brassica carinata]